MGIDQRTSVKSLRDPVSSRMGYLLRRASAAIMADLGNAMAVLGLRPVEGTILILVGVNPGCIQSDLGRTLGIKRANMAPLISALSAKGYLEKAAIDGRSLALSLTPAGEKARARVDKIMDAHEARFAHLHAAFDKPAIRAALAQIAAYAKEDAAT